jgi:hypothetical protein
LQIAGAELDIWYAELTVASHQVAAVAATAVSLTVLQSRQLRSLCRNVLQQNEGMVMSDKPETQVQSFQLEEATIDDLHRALLSGVTTVVAVVEHYSDRVRKYNGVASMLVTTTAHLFLR